MKALAITQRDGSQGTLAVSDVDELAERLRGRLVRRGDADYASVRTVWNGMMEKQPALIARVQGVADVIEAMRFARQHDIRMNQNIRPAKERRPARSRDGSLRL